MSALRVSDIGIKFHKNLNFIYDDDMEMYCPAEKKQCSRKKWTNKSIRKKNQIQIVVNDLSKLAQLVFPQQHKPNGSSEGV